MDQVTLVEDGAEGLNRIAEVFRSRGVPVTGVYLIKVTERKPPEQASDFEKIKDGVRDLCTAELQLAVMSELRKSAKVQFNLPK